MGFFGNSNKEDVEEEEEEEDTYEYNHECENCKNDIDLEIPLGIKVSDYLKDKVCEVCGCKISET